MENLLHLIGRVKAKERELISTPDWQRFLEPGPLAGWLEQLKSTAYAACAEAAQTFEDFETGLNKYLAGLKQDLFAQTKFSFSPLLWKKYDFHNFKIFLKMKLGYKDLKKYLLPLGDINISDLESYLLGNEKPALDLHWQKTLRQAREIYEQTGRFSALDIFLDKIYFQELLREAEKFGPEIRQFYKKIVDRANFNLWFFQKNEPQSKVDYLTQGNIPARFFVTANFAAEQLAAKIFDGLNLEPEIEEALLQKKIDDHLAERLWAKRFNSRGFFPVLVFFWAKETEIKNLKICYLRRAKQLEKLGKFLRKTYV